MKLLLILLLLIIVMWVTKGGTPVPDDDEAHWNKHQDHIVPRYHPVYLDAQTPYFNEQIMYGEWPQEISSSL